MSEMSETPSHDSPPTKSPISNMYQRSRSMAATASYPTDMNIREKDLAILALSRRLGEALLIQSPIGEHVEVTVLAMDGRHIRLGRDAPEHIRVLREERTYLTWIRSRSARQWSE